MLDMHSLGSRAGAPGGPPAGAANCLLCRAHARRRLAASCPANDRRQPPQYRCQLRMVRGGDQGLDFDRRTAISCTCHVPYECPRLHGPTAVCCPDPESTAVFYLHAQHTCCFSRTCARGHVRGRARAARGGRGQPLPQRRAAGAPGGGRAGRRRRGGHAAARHLRQRQLAQAAACAAHRHSG